MPALDRYHEPVRHALTKDGWAITDDPLTLELDERKLYADFGAERLLAAERGTERIAVEIKTFRSPSPIADLEQAIGQYSLYEDILRVLKSDRVLFLAIPEDAFAQIFSERIGQIALQNRIKRAFVLSPTRWEQVPNPVLSLFRITGVQDTAHDRYTLTHVDFNGDSYKSHLLAHLEIKDGKIWILTDNTEDGIAAELVAEGIAKEQIVLGFYPVGMREAGEFAAQ